MGFDVQAYLGSTGVARRVLNLAAGAVIYTQGNRASSVMYIHSGSVKVSVVSSGGKEAVIGILGTGDFFGEGCLAGQTRRMATATTLEPSKIVRIAKATMRQMLHAEPALSDRFIAHMLSRNIRIEEDLVDQLFNSTEKRLARTLLLLARYGNTGSGPRLLARIPQETLAEMVGTTRSRVNIFMNKFRKLGFIEYHGERKRGLKINDGLLTVVLHD